MGRVGLLAVAVVLLSSGCGGSGSSSSQDRELQRQADMHAIDAIEKTWHQAASNQDVDLMMSIWAADATFNIGTETLRGRSQIRDFFTHKAGPFLPGHHWVSDTPAYKVRITVNGDKGTLYFECDYIDVATKKVVSVVAADQNVQRIDGTWLITSAAAATPTLGP
jgi:ketosteroid isomerase-like protein